MIRARELLRRAFATLAAAAFLTSLWAGARYGAAGGEARPVAAAVDEDQPMYYVRTTDKVLGLTFDISWGTKAVEDVLAVLRDHRIRATFFLSGPWSAQHPDLVRRIARDGHEIASHGQAHVNLSQRSEAEIAANLSDAARILVGLTGQTPRFFRPPNGDFDRRVVRIAREQGQETVIWSVDSLDWIQRDPAAIAARVVRGAFPGAVLLFHASDSAPSTAAALPAVFEELTRMGYRFVPLGDLLKYGPPAREDPRGRPYKPNMGR
ncbi:MAG: polysaccharide deacetylase family protein [Firmicutes bacterium]|nr:polysaccharide deacetylase family protein [Bacillota bacterium]